MRRLLFLLIFALLIGGGGAYYLLNNPGSLQAFTQRISTGQNLDWSQAMKAADSTVANGIRAAARGEIKLPSALTNPIHTVSSATISASIAITPQELSKLIQEKGAQGALSELTNRIQVSAGDLGANVIDEARYQYCLGVVQSRQK